MKITIYELAKANNNETSVQFLKYFISMEKALAWYQNKYSNNRELKPVIYEREIEVAVRK